MSEAFLRRTRYKARVGLRTTAIRHQDVDLRELPDLSPGHRSSWPRQPGEGRNPWVTGFHALLEPGWLRYGVKRGGPNHLSTEIRLWGPMRPEHQEAFRKLWLLFLFLIFFKMI